MALGLSRREQYALIGLVGLILAGAGYRTWRAASAPDVLYVPGQGQWIKLAEFEAGQTPPLADDVPATTDSATTASIAVRRAGETKEAGVASEGGLDLNRATVEELDLLLPGIGPAKARAIVETRDRLGGFSSIEDLDQTPGIGPALLKRVRPYLRVDGVTTGSLAPAEAAATSASLAFQKPIGEATAGAAIAAEQVASAPTPTATDLVDINSAGLDELQSLKGVGPVIAQRIIEDRQRRGPFGRPEDLIRVRGIGPKILSQNLSRIRVE